MGRRLSGPAAAVLPTLLGAALTLLSSSRTWVEASLTDPVLGRTAIDATGRQAAAVVPAVALVALAGGVALLLARALGRRVAGVLLVVAGAMGAASTVTVLRVPGSGVTDLVTKAVGVVGSQPTATQVTWWPWLALVGCGLVCLGGAVAVLRAGGWARPRGRYDSPAVDTGPERDSPERSDSDPGRTWDALSRGEDPTR
jgi:uncharacterized membrane protein (TIGR02234 family)